MFGIVGKDFVLLAADRSQTNSDSSAAAEFSRKRRHAELRHANATAVVAVDACSPLHCTCARWLRWL
jgi:hypothetical protein